MISSDLHPESPIYDDLPSADLRLDGQGSLRAAILCTPAARVPALETSVPMDHVPAPDGCDALEGSWDLGIFYIGFNGI